MPLININNEKQEINMVYVLEIIKRFRNSEAYYFQEIFPKYLEKKKTCQASDEYGKELWKFENIQDEIIIDNVKLGQGTKSEWKFRYYETYFNSIEDQSKTIKEACNRYLEGIKWVFEYYFNGCTDWTWQYEFTHAPFIEDIYNYIIETDYDLNNIKFDSKTPLTPFMQLFVVIPRKYIELIPKEYHKLINDMSIIDLFPEKVDIDKLYKDQQWQCIPMLPAIDVDRIKDLLKNIIVTDTRNL